MSLVGQVFGFGNLDRILGTCPKRVGSFGSSTRFQKRKVVGKNDVCDIDSVRKL